MDKTSIHTDHDLTELIRKGSHSAFQEVYSRYWPVLYIHAYKMLRDEESAMDIIQDVFTDLWFKGERLHIQQSLKAYLYTSVRYRTLDALRKSSQHDKFLSAMVDFAKEGHNTTEEEVSLQEFIKRMEAEVAQLPPRMREIFELSRFEGKSNKSIADELQITDHTVKKTLNRVIACIALKADLDLLTSLKTFLTQAYLSFKQMSAHLLFIR